MSENKSLEIVNEKSNEVNEFNYQVENIKNLIYTIRGKQVMLDSDVAMLYQYTTKNINKAMKRNISRFPEDFCFQLTEKEVKNLRFQFGTSSCHTPLLIIENKNLSETFVHFFSSLYSDSLSPLDTASPDRCPT